MAGWATLSVSVLEVATAEVAPSFSRRLRKGWDFGPQQQAVLAIDLGTYEGQSRNSHPCKKTQGWGSLSIGGAINPNGKRMGHPAKERKGWATRPFIIRIQKSQNPHALATGARRVGQPARESDPNCLKLPCGLVVMWAGRDASTSQDRPLDDPAALNMTAGRHRASLEGQPRAAIPTLGLWWFRLGISRAGRSRHIGACCLRMTSSGR